MRLVQDTFEHLRGWLRGRGDELVAHRLYGSSAQKAASATECKDCQKCFAGVSTRQDLLEDLPDQDSAFAPRGCSGQAIQRGQERFNVGPTDRALLFVEKMRKERKCAAVLVTDIIAAFYSVFAEIALGGLFPLDTREQLFDKAGLSGRIRQAVRELLAEDAVVMAQGLEPVWRRAALDWHNGCSFGVKGNEGRTMLWSGTRPGDTMADLIFCLAFLRLQMTLEERLTQRGIVNVTASARKGIFDGKHEEGCTSLLNPTFMDDLAVLVEGDTPEKTLAKLSSALQTVREVCQENALALNMSAGKTEAIVLIQGK